MGWYTGGGGERGEEVAAGEWVRGFGLAGSDGTSGGWRHLSFEFTDFRNRRIRTGRDSGGRVNRRKPHGKESS